MKTKEEILSAVQAHHRLVKENFGGPVLMTSLFGSQNYELDDEQSDIDTVSFVMPSIRNIARLEQPVSYEFNVDDGKCTVKDIRMGLHLLKKTNPNSIEWFASQYIVFHPDYEASFKSFLESDVIYHANYQSMLDACSGMSRQLSKRNMPIGKRYAHALRILDMWMNFKFGDNPILSFRSGITRDTALGAKRNVLKEAEPYYKEQITEIENYFDTERIIKPCYVPAGEKAGWEMIDEFQTCLMNYAFAKEIFSEYKPPLVTYGGSTWKGYLQQNEKKIP